MTRFNKNDLLAKDKLEVSTFLIYKKQYREISNDAKLMYQYLLKRFSVSEVKLEEAMEANTMENFSFLDENEDLFCFCSNDELRFVLNLSEKSVIKAKKELAAVQLLDEVKQTAHKTNRLYVNKVTMVIEDRTEFKEGLVAFKEAEHKKRKEKNAKRNTKKTSNPQNPQPKKEVEIIEPKSEPQNLQFSEPQNLQFMNRKNYSHSTKEEDITKEPKSTKESIITSLNSINALEMPTKLVIKKNIDRIVKDNIDIQDIIVFYLSTDNMLADNDFNNVLDNVLQYTKGKIGNIKNLLKTSVKTYMDEVKEEAPDALVQTTSPNGIIMFNWLEA